MPQPDPSPPPSPSPRRFQFTLRGMLWATFWVAVGLIPWAPAIQFVRERRWPDTTLGSMLPFALMASTLTPFIAIGSLFRRPLLGFQVAIIVLGTGIILTGVMVLILSQAGIFH